MIDLATFFREGEQALAPAETPDFPTFPTSKAARGNGQVSDDATISHTSHISHTETSDKDPAYDFNLPGRARAGGGAWAREKHPADVGNVGSVGKANRANVFPFPHSTNHVGNGGKSAEPPAPTPAAEAQAAFEERAGFLEFDCGLSREAAEAQARGDANGSAVLLWRAGLASLRPDVDPCPGFGAGEWRQTLEVAHRFLDEFGEEAAALGWTTEQLFGVHPTHGIIRVDLCGAIVLAARWPVVAVEPTLIRVAHLAHRRDAPGKTYGIPIWAFVPIAISRRAP